METVFDALKAMGRASSQEVAARLGMTRDEAINELWKLKRRGEADNKGPMWWLTSGDEEKQAGYRETPVVDLIPQRGTESEKTARQEASGTENTGQHADVTEVVQPIPAFTEKQQDYVILPSLHAANRELRRAKGQVQKWERICAALRELNKHRDVVRQIVDSSRRVASEK
ncbi:DUF1627 domain-containing protein [Escherichia coli]|uniref:DUF1627 domain-containing protein n=1 Tax=Escherichia coli TaxID=562 RepID=UPI0031B5CBBE|nr:DUF1627 domain-containing protein [Escherichia coli]HCR5404139.1 DUF1627 domain-containing protein [Shigella dysenteriae]